MTPQQIVGLAVRLFAIWVAFAAFQIVASGMSINNQAGLQSTHAFYISAAGMFVVAILLWLFPLVIAHKLIPRTKFENILRVPATEAAMVACVIIGLWLFAIRVLPSFAYYVALVVAMRANNQPLSASDEFSIIKFGSVAIEFSVCLFLCFRAHAISHFFTIERKHVEDE